MFRYRKICESAHRTAQSTFDMLEVLVINISLILSAYYLHSTNSNVL